MKRIKWTYIAEFDYIQELERGKWVVGFLNEEGSPYECPITDDPKLVEKLLKLIENSEVRKLRVTVEINEEPDKYGRQYPILINVEASEN